MLPPASSSDDDGKEASKRGVVAVVGGGIAGCGAAWMLARDGFEVHLYEARTATSGNARTFDWVDDVWAESGTSKDKFGKITYGDVILGGNNPSAAGVEAVATVSSKTPCIPG